jgi:predicted transposase/invertase (TIGR01784 family)
MVDTTLLMDDTALSPKNDYVFKEIFSKNLEILSDFLRTVLGRTFEKNELKLLDPALSRDRPEDKFGVLDVRVETGLGESVDIEIQVRPQKVIWQRLKFYTYKMYVIQLKSGQSYANLHRTISILVADFNLFNNNAFHHRYELYDKMNNHVYPESEEIHI